MLKVALTNNLGHEVNWDRPTEVLLMAAWGEQGLLDRPSRRVMSWKNGTLSQGDLEYEPGLDTARTYQTGGMSLLARPRMNLRRSHEAIH